MSAAATHSFTLTSSYVFTETLSTGDNEEISRPYVVTDKVVKKYGIDTYLIAAAGNGDIWPDAVGSIAAGDAIHFELQFYFGSLETLIANKALTVTVNAEVIKGWGQNLAFEESAATTVVVARSGGNEDLVVKVIWYVYTV